MIHGLLLMTALPPTKGHVYLINFANNFMNCTEETAILHVIVNGRPHEPIHVADRVRALKEHFKNYFSVKFYYDNRNVPQEPNDHPNFWGIWNTLITQMTSRNKFDYVFASESYGVTLAETVGARFIPFNIDRSIIPVHATEVRNDPIKYFDQILPSFQKQIRKVVTIFGPESVGKTTLAKALSERINGYFVPEWARGYLETVGPEVTKEKMKEITYGQYSLQESVRKLIDKPFIIQDTDLLSTYGYYELWDDHHVPEMCKYYMSRSMSDVYILMNDQIPFTPDILRYGGDKRETDNSYWRKLLKNFDCEFYEMQSFYPQSQVDEAEKFCINYFNRTNDLRFLR